MAPDIRSSQNAAHFPTALIYSHSAVRADVRLTDPSRSPAPCLCSELFPSIRERSPARFSASLLLSLSYIHLREAPFAPGLFAKP